MGNHQNRTQYYVVGYTSSASLFLKWTDASVALVKHVPSDEKQPLANVQELELWRQEIRSWNEKFAGEKVITSGCQNMLLPIDDE